MDAQLKARWVEALRSGKYRQGTISLKRGGKYCCLGVLAEISDLPLGEPKDFDAAYKTFPLQVKDIYALERMNDTERKTFPEIAAYIEANL